MKRSDCVTITGLFVSDLSALALMKAARPVLDR